MADDQNQKEKIALALSGGGSRAMAFHLGCLRALHKQGLLERTDVISAVSGGSVIAALFCTHAGDFAAFEARLTEVLVSGFVRPALKKSVTTLEGVKALSCIIPLLAIRVLVLITTLALNLAPITGPMKHRVLDFLNRLFFRRFASRTTILRRVFADDLFEHKTLGGLRKDRPKLIVVACELQTKSAFYFARDGVGSWRLGTTEPSRIEIAHAVAASAAYPGFLPALDQYLDLNKRGRLYKQRVILTDGGVYDNLGLAPLWPDRDSEVSLHADKYDTIIACRAGYSSEMGPPPVFWTSRMLAVIDTIHTRAQNAAMSRLFDLKRAGALAGFIIPYLGQADDKLAFPPKDLIAGSSVARYPTDFSAMPKEWIERLSKRGEQLTLALLREHLPHLISAKEVT